MMNRIKIILKCIKTILNYDLKGLPNDLMHTFNSRVYGVVFFTLILMFLTGLLICFLISIMTKTDNILRVFPFYVLSMSLNSALLFKRPHYFCVDKHPMRGLKIFLFIISGPFGLIKAAHLLMCMMLILDPDQFNTVSKNPSDIWGRCVRESRSGKRLDMLSLLKFQGRLRKRG